MALLLARRKHESIYLKLDPQANAQELLLELATKGIEFHVIEIKKSAVITGIVAPAGVGIWRGELLDEGGSVRPAPKRKPWHRELRRSCRRLVSLVWKKCGNYCAVLLRSRPVKPEAPPK